MRLPRLSVLLSVLLSCCWLGGACAQPMPHAQPVYDEPYLTNGRTALDDLFNLIIPTGQRALVDQRPEQGTHFYWEGEHMLNLGQYVDTEWTRHAAGWPLYHPAAICYAGPNRIGAWTWHVQTPAPVVPKAAGAHHVWVRWVRYKQLPCPLDVRVIQGGKRVVTARIGEELNDVPHGYMGGLEWAKVEVPALNAQEPVRIELHKPADDGPAGHRVIDAVYLTSNLDYEPVGRRQLPMIEQLREQAAYLAGGEPFVFWPADNPWDPFGLGDWPTGGDIAGHVAITACRNEREPALVRVTSMTDQPLQLPIQVGRFREIDSGAAYGAPEVRVVAQLDTTHYGWVPHTLFRRPAVGLPPYRTAGLWIEADTTGMPPGRYLARIDLGTGENQRYLAVRLTVLPVKVERSDKFLTGMWGAPIPTPEGVDKWEAWIRDVAAHGVNYPVDVPYDQRGLIKHLLPHKDLLHELGIIGMVTTIADMPWTTFHTKVGMDEAQLEQTMRRALEPVAALARELGYEPSDFTVRFTDEPAVNMELARWLARVHQMADAVGQGLRTTMNPVDIDPDEVRTVGDAIDMWMPPSAFLVRSDLFEAMADGPGTHRLTMYNHTSDKQDPGQPWSWFRRSMWRAHRHGLKGYFAYNYYETAGLGQPWTEKDNNQAAFGESQWVIAFPGTAGPVPTPSWRAFREGREDVDRLILLDRLIADARAQGRDDAARRAQFKMDKAHELACEPTGPESFARANRLVIEAIIDLSPTPAN